MNDSNAELIFSLAVITIVLVAIVVNAVFPVKARIKEKNTRKNGGTLFIEESPIGISAWFGLNCTLADLANKKEIIFRIEHRMITQEEHEQKIENKETSIYRRHNNDI